MIEESVIETLGAQGDGVTASGVFVPFALPGEVVRVTVQGHRAKLESVVQKAAERVTPDCPHFGRCGGCTLQHAADGLVAAWKRSVIQQSLAQRGITGVDIRPVETSPSGSRRRVTVTARRTKKSALVGFHEAGSDQIVPIESCAVADPAIVRLVPRIGEFVSVGASRKGELRITITTSDSGLDVSVTGGKAVEGPVYGQLVAIAATSDLARLSWNDEVIVTRRSPGQIMGRARVVPPPGGFLQATAHGESVLVDAVSQAIGKASLVADLFAGSGTFSLPLAETSEVLAVESNQPALDALDLAWRHAEGLKRIETESRDLFRRPLLGREIGGIEALVIDPPRQGARAQFEQIALSETARIAAVSCNPATFARDARILVDGGYTLDWIQPVDQFRWSPHIELAAAFSRH